MPRPPLPPLAETNTELRGPGHVPTPPRPQTGFARGRPSPRGRPHLFAFTDFLPRSEEHTSELQSPVHLVCRLLLEKKKPDTSCKLFHILSHQVCDKFAA